MSRWIACPLRKIETRLLDKRLGQVEEEWIRADGQVRRLDSELTEKNKQIDELRKAINNNGGDRLEQLAAEIRKKEQLRDGRQNKAERYGRLAAMLHEPIAADAAAFADQRDRFKSWREEDRERDADLQNSLTEHGVTLRQGKLEHDELSTEINSLKGRRSNIERSADSDTRRALCGTGIHRGRNALYWGVDPNSRKRESLGRRRREVIAELRAHTACSRFTLHGG